MKKGLWPKLALVAGLIGLAAAVRLLHLEQYLSLGYLKSSKNSLLELYHLHPFIVVAVYSFIYVAVTALSIPGAMVMTLAGGALFGLVTGTIIVSFASTAGASLAFIVARFLLRDWVQERFRDKLAPINRGIEKEGAFYLFSLRLVPVFPFFVINLVMGITKMPLVTYFWVSQLGMLPGTIVYVNAGKELGAIEAPSDIMSPGLISAFVLLGILPLAAKRVVAFYRARKG